MQCIGHAEKKESTQLVTPQTSGDMSTCTGVLLPCLGDASQVWGGPSIAQGVNAVVIRPGHLWGQESARTLQVCDASCQATIRLPSRTNGFGRAASMWSMGVTGYQCPAQSKWLTPAAPRGPCAIADTIKGLHSCR